MGKTSNNWHFRAKNVCIDLTESKKIDNLWLRRVQKNCKPLTAQSPKKLPTIDSAESKNVLTNYSPESKYFPGICKDFFLWRKENILRALLPCFSVLKFIWFHDSFLCMYKLKVLKVILLFLFKHVLYDDTTEPGQFFLSKTPVAFEMD